MIKTNKLILFLLTCLVACSSGSIYAQAYSWANPAGSNNASEEGFGVAVDNAGDVISVGTFRGTVDFDPSVAVANLSASTADAGYVCKFNAAGAYQWAFQIGDRKSVV